MHAVTHDTRVNGPGRRAMVHLQGCTLGCPGCFNPETHTTDLGDLRGIASLVAELLAHEPEGITVSGGEPFQQPHALARLLAALRAAGVDSVLIFTGFSLTELEAMPEAQRALAHTDVLVAGRYQVKEPIEGHPLLSSANQRLHLLTGRHHATEVALTDQVEITIRPNGDVTMTGFPTPALRRALKTLD